MKKVLVFATNNAHKLYEVQQLIGESFILKGLNDIGFSDDIPETGRTFEENSMQKSKCIYEHFKLDCFADDSGLEVEALNNAPGIFSARYSGTRDSLQNLELVLKKLEGESNRKARFRAVITLIIDGEVNVFEGLVAGTIRTAPSGTEGFGYDPIFQPEGYEVTFSEMSTEEKNKISHRGKAMAKLVDFLNSRQKL
jgi:XTP/dITP diphosphohydrolase